jgi:hypothetical protein
MALSPDLREAIALVILYRACSDPELRERVRRLVPTIDDALEAFEAVVPEQGVPEQESDAFAGLVRGPQQ